ncbi:hypothetical protein [Nocardia terpenica]|nr:hypothetical protein [Nocardia terpenica]
MLLRLRAVLLFVTTYLPVAALRRIGGASPFGRRAYRAATAWDL